MAKKGQLRGALLEEVIMVLLRGSGYVPVVDKGNDLTLSTCAAGLQVRGRGTAHQIDAIADFTIPQPFTNPQRLLVEAKAHDKVRKIGLDVVRNAVGVLKDVNEFWRVDGQNPAGRARFHYQAAIFSTSGFSSNAQHYAFAQDVYLLPLKRSAHLTPVLNALSQVSNVLADDPTATRIRELRKQFRAAMHGEDGETDEALQPLLNACRTFSNALLGMIAGRFPVFLVPIQPESIENLDVTTRIRIHFDDQGWYIGLDGDERAFSFDLPDELFQMYAVSGQLSRQEAVNMKGDLLQTITAFHIQYGRPRVITLELDQHWLEAVQERIHTERREEKQHFDLVEENVDE